MSEPHTLTKTRLMAWRQCAKKLWLLAHKPEAADWSGSDAVFAAGDSVGEVARRIYGAGPVIDIREGAHAAVSKTAECLARGERHVYEAAFIHQGVLVLADVLERVNDAPPWCYRQIEVKSSTHAKQTHIEDAAVQSWVIEGAGYALAGVHVAHIDSGFVFRVVADYQGLLIEVPVSGAIALLREEIPQWVRAARITLDGAEPDIGIGAHCHAPYACPFLDYCAPRSRPEYPVGCLPHGGRLIAELESEGYADLRDVPESRLRTDKHRRVWLASRTGAPYLDPVADDTLRALPYPRHYLDFETIAFAVPCWIGTRPYQQSPFQWSLHRQDMGGSLHHHAFLDTSGDSPMRACMSALLDALDGQGPIVVYGAFESRILKEMADFLPDLAAGLHALRARLFDLLPLLRDHYYHPAMKGSWSIKAVLPAIAPELDYERLAVKDGGGAQAAYLAMIAATTPVQRKAELRAGLLEYCGQDTLAMVRIVSHLCGGV